VKQRGTTGSAMDSLLLEEKGGKDTRKGQGQRKKKKKSEMLSKYTPACRHIGVPQRKYSGRVGGGEKKVGKGTDTGSATWPTELAVSKEKTKQ